MQFIWKRIRFHVSAVSQLYDDERASIQMTWKPIRMKIINLIFCKDDVNSEIDIWVKGFMNINSFTRQSDESFQLKHRFERGMTRFQAWKELLLLKIFSIAKISTAIARQLVNNKSFLSHISTLVNLIIIYSCSTGNAEMKAIIGKMKTLWMSSWRNLQKNPIWVGCAIILNIKVIEKQEA